MMTTEEMLEIAHEADLWRLAHATELPEGVEYWFDQRHRRGASSTFWGGFYDAFRAKTIPAELVGLRPSLTAGPSPVVGPKRALELIHWLCQIDGYNDHPCPIELGWRILDDRPAKPRRYRRLEDGTVELVEDDEAVVVGVRNG